MESTSSAIAQGIGSIIGICLPLIIGSLIYSGGNSKTRKIIGGILIVLGILCILGFALPKLLGIQN
jgi:hypothetical protein